jgi:hypothetical protein
MSYVDGKTDNKKGVNLLNGTTLGFPYTPAIKPIE